MGGVSNLDANSFVSAGYEILTAVNVDRASFSRSLPRDFGNDRLLRLVLPRPVPRLLGVPRRRRTSLRTLGLGSRVRFRLAFALAFAFVVFGRVRPGRRTFHLLVLVRDGVAVLVHLLNLNVVPTCSSTFFPCRVKVIVAAAAASIAILVRIVLSLSFLVVSTTTKVVLVIVVLFDIFLLHNLLLLLLEHVDFPLAPSSSRGGNGQVARATFALVLGTVGGYGAPVPIEFHEPARRGFFFFIVVFGVEARVAAIVGRGKTTSTRRRDALARFLLCRRGSGRLFRAERRANGFLFLFVVLLLLLDRVAFFVVTSAIGLLLVLIVIVSVLLLLLGFVLASKAGQPPPSSSSSRLARRIGEPVRLRGREPLARDGPLARGRGRMTKSRRGAAGSRGMLALISQRRDGRPCRGIRDRPKSATEGVRSGITPAYLHRLACRFHPHRTPRRRPRRTGTPGSPF